MKQTLCSRIARTVLALAFPIAALADLNQTTTLPANTALNLDTGVTSGSGGDILWSGSSVTPQGKAKAAVFGNVGAAGFSTFTQPIVQSLLAASGSTASIPSSALVAGLVFVVSTNGGNSAKLLVTANSGGSLTLQFTTFGASGGGGGGPTITLVQNNSSRTPNGFPNSGIAPSTLFVVIGTGLADAGDATLHSSEGAGLQTTLNGASITVVVGGTTVHPALYYATPTQIDGVMPAATPVGTGTLTVTYKGVASAAFTIQVVTAAPGITTFNGSGVATDATTGALLTYTKSGFPGEIIILWGTGLGADPADSDTTYTTSPHQVSVSYTIYIGGVQATVVYQGGSIYPGVGVFGVTIPASVPTGCYIPVAAVTGNIVSNIVTLPIHAGGGACSDPQLGIDGNTISTLGGQTTVKTGTVLVAQSTGPGATGAPATSNSALAIFQQITGATYSGGAGGLVSIGGCVVTVTTGGGGSTGTTTGLDAGTITVTGPGGAPVTLGALPGFVGFYLGTLSSIPSTGGAFVFNGAGGATVGKFTATVNFPNPLLNWTNQSAAATVTRSQGLLVTWTGGAAGTYVIISGTSVSGTASGSYTCIAPVAALQFTVPSYVLLSLPAGTGTTSVQNSTNFTSFTATGLDFGGALGSVGISVNSTHN